MIVPPALPEPGGINAARANFYREAACAFELMALWHSLPVQDQRAFRDAVQSMAASAAELSVKDKR